MRLVIGHGDGENFRIIEEGGIRRPFVLVTMDVLWWEAAAELELPRLFFKDKLRMMRYCLGHDLICVTFRDGNDKTAEMCASFEAMNAVTYRVYQQ